MLSYRFDLSIIIQLHVFITSFGYQIYTPAFTFGVKERSRVYKYPFIQNIPHDLLVRRIPYTSTYHKSWLILNSAHEFENYEANALFIEAAASHTSSSYKILGIKSLGVDYGLVRTGLATTVGYNPTPLAIISNMNSTQLCQEIVKWVEKENVQQIIVGLPLHKNGTVAEQTVLTRAFAQQLACSVYASFGPSDTIVEDVGVEDNLTPAIPIFLWDERYTSKEAEARIRATNPKRRMGRLYGELDADAACIILEHFYADSGNGAERVIISQHDPSLINLIKESWVLRCQEKKKASDDKLKMKLQGTHLNAKQMAMERARILDAQLALQYGLKINNKKRNKR